jgi:hypothetical protein
MAASCVLVTHGDCRHRQFGVGVDGMLVIVAASDQAF